MERFLSPLDIFLDREQKSRKRNRTFDMNKYLFLFPAEKFFLNRGKSPILGVPNMPPIVKPGPRRLTLYFDLP